MFHVLNTIIMFTSKEEKNIGTTTHKRVLHIGEGRGTKSTGYPKVDRKDK